ncbi:hypothetical protein ABZ468_07925 [Streptomyces sp. NPDC005708]|uniref:hypothetical protein n=1 Tax=Streptomyces sp. NPDC005708 TaxID=3154564 RepID=UPI0033D84F54
MATARPRKTAATKADADTTTTTTTEETTAAAADNSAPQEPEQEPTAAPAPEETAATDEGPAAPDAAPLEPPAVQETPQAPATEPGYVSPTEVIPDEENLSEVILDDATKLPPADPEAVFQPLTPYGSTFVCTVRLIERTFLGPHQNPIHRLLQPAGAHVSESVAARIMERLVAQASKSAAADTEK